MGRKSRKPGCRTCRVRKVRCDQSFPECDRCLTTGRSCDGYGVWGGGKPVDQDCPLIDRGIIHHPPDLRLRTLSVLNISADDQETLHWFQCRTMPKLPGSFRSRFWSTLLSQASAAEPIIMHAILALGSVHRGGVVADGWNALSAHSSRRLTHDGLQHYVTAIGQLRTRCTRKDTATLRVVLIACLAFFSLELLRGHFGPARAHLSNGMRILREARLLKANNEPSKLVLESPDAVDQWIVEAFQRANLQTELFDVLFLNEKGGNPVCPSRQPVPPVFRSYREAWVSLERLILTATFLIKVSTKSMSKGLEVENSPMLYQRRSQLQTDLDDWLTPFIAARESLLKDADEEDSKAFSLLHLNHRLAVLLADVSLCGGEASAFDNRTSLFVDMIKPIAHLWRHRSQHIGRDPQAGGQCFYMSHSILDLGCIHALYFTAVRCGDLKVRVQATKMLHDLRHREGFWDASIAAAVAQEVLEIEYADSFSKLRSLFCFSDDVSCIGISAVESSLPSHRLQRLRVELSGDPVGTVSLYHNLAFFGEADSMEIKLAEYNVQQRSWMNGVMLL